MLKHQQKKLPRQGAVKKIDGREICNLDSAEGRRIYKERTEEMAIRQGHRCAICHCRLWDWNTQFDHEAGRTVGKRDDRIVDSNGDWINAALCGVSNVLKGSKRYKWINGQYLPTKRLQEVA